MTVDEPQVEADAVAAFAETFHGLIVRPGDDEYEAARRVWNGMIDKHPALVAYCTGVADVIAAVAFAREQGLPIAVRGGGHNVAGTAVCDDGIVIDLSEMRSVLVDPEARTARVQAGATWGDVDRETQVFGLIAPGGVVSETGVAGLTLGGGYSHTRRKYGLTSDSLRSVDIVTADGDFLTASADENEDLFWALRGGGGNFGVVTAFEYDLHELGPDVAVAAVMYPMDAAATVLREWRDFMLEAPDGITSDADFWSVPEYPLFPEEFHRTPVLVVAGVYAGPVADGEAALQPLRELAEPMVDISGVHRYAELQTMFDPFFPRHELRYYWKSRYVDELSDDAIDTIVEYASERPSARTIVPIRARGGQIARIDPAETAFADRTSPFMISIDSVWEDPEDDEENREWTREFWDAMGQYSSGGMYFNFAMGEEGPDALRATFEGNYDRLLDTKREYDPDDVFRANQPIKPTA